MKDLKVLIGEDHALMSSAIRLALSQTDGFEIVGEASSGSQVVPLVGRTNPDVVLLDMRMPGMDGLACLDLIRTRHPKVKVVMLSALDERRQIEAALRRGASGYIVKSINPADLPSAIRQSVEGNVYSPALMAETNGAARDAGLSNKEIGVLEQLTACNSNKEIAKALWISEQTVKFHLRNIYRKLRISNRAEAVRYAYRQNLVASPVLDKKAA